MRRDWLYEKIARPFLFRLDPERAHYLVQQLLRCSAPLRQLAAAAMVYPSESLRQQLFGITFANPVGLAAGFDKNGYLVKVLDGLGFGFAEVGSVTALPSSGNPKPRLFRLPDDEALINRLGLNGEGAEAVAERLKTATWHLPVAVNIAKTNLPGTESGGMVDDMMRSFRAVKDLPVAFVTVNASCPNTPEGIVREAEELDRLFAGMQVENTRQLPILVKLSPDSSDELLRQIISSARRNALAGFVCGNTTISREGLRTPPHRLEEIGAGGLSGIPLREQALALCRKVYSRKNDEQIIIGVGGVFTGRDAYAFVRAGANLVELYTSLVYRGPRVVSYINEELHQLLAADGLTLRSALGLDLRCQT